MFVLRHSSSTGRSAPLSSSGAYRTSRVVVFLYFLASARASRDIKLSNTRPVGVATGPVAAAGRLAARWYVSVDSCAPGPHSGQARPVDAGRRADEVQERTLNSLFFAVQVGGCLGRLSASVGCRERRPSSRAASSS